METIFFTHSGARSSAFSRGYFLVAPARRGGAVENRASIDTRRFWHRRPSQTGLFDEKAVLEREVRLLDTILWFIKSAIRTVGTFTAMNRWENIAWEERAEILNNENGTGGEGFYLVKLKNTICSSVERWPKRENHNQGVCAILCINRDQESGQGWHRLRNARTLRKMAFGTYLQRSQSPRKSPMTL